MFNDLIDFFKFQSKGIEHYIKYSTSLIFFIVIVLEIPFTYFSEGYESSTTSDLAINLLIAIPSVLFEALFFVYWLGRKDKKYSFLTVLNFTAMLTITASIPLIAWEAISPNIDSSSWGSIIAALIFVIYIFYLMVANMSVATGVSKKYALGGFLVIIGLLQIPTQLLIL